MKKRVLAVVMCALMAGTAFTGFKDAGDDKELVLFTWEGMFPQEVLDDFEKETELIDKELTAYEEKRKKQSGNMSTP